MEVQTVERIDHHGIVAGVIKDLGIVERIDSLLGRAPDEKISTGEAVAGMIINGLGFTDRPMTLTPQFFENCPIELLFREGVEPGDFNRFKLGRALDNLYEFGCSALFSDLALNACKKEGIEHRFGHLDTTSFSLTGEYDECCDEYAVKVKHGYSKDHRPDLKQVVLELLVTQDGGIPLIAKLWDGNTSDNEIFNARSKALLEALKTAESPVYLIADSKLYAKSNSENLLKVPFITRIPEVISEVKEKIRLSFSEKTDWIAHTKKRKYKEFELEHYGIQQRWHVVCSEQARERVEKTINKNVGKEKITIEKELFHLKAQVFGCPDDAKKDFEKKHKKWKYHLLDSIEIEEVKKYSTLGRPKPGVLPDKISYKISASFKENTDKINKEKEEGSCYVLGTNVPSKTLNSIDIIDNYSEQQTVERGFRFLKDPIFFTSSLFIKKPSRIEAMLMVMCLALVVYAIAERKMRKILEAQNETIPNQIKKPVTKPTLRWVFQLLDGISRVKIINNGITSYIWTGLTELRRKILHLFGPTVADMYQII